MSRYDSAASDFAAVKKAAEGVTTSGESFVTYMDDLNTYLSTDLNAGGIASGAPLISNADSRASELKMKLAALESSMKKVASDFAASGKGAAPTAAPAPKAKLSWWW
jgi:outer membrane murein-binding lipoprotein Lpp